MMLLLTSSLLLAITPSPVSRVVSDPSLRLAPQPSVRWQDGAACPADASIEVLPRVRHQTIGGFGASMLEAGAMNLNSLPTSKQEELLDLLFGKSGARLSAMKATMLGNDFSTATHGEWTTYDDTPEDFALKHFSIARDLGVNGSLTFIKRALKAGFEGTIQAYMDYPPDWMLVDSNTSKTIRSDCYDVLAHYQAAYVAAYASHGVHIDFLESFNEPTDSYTQMSPQQLATFLGQHLGPTFERLGLWPKTRLTFGGQCTRESAAAAVPVVFADAKAARFMDVIAYHGYDCQFEDDGSCTDARQNYDAVAQLAARHPAKPLWMTEICYAYNGDDPNCTKAATMQDCVDYPRNHSLAPPLPRRDFADGATWGHRLVQEMRAGASGWIYWNLLLDVMGGPFNLSPSHNDGPGNYQHPVIVTDPAAGTYHPTGLFYFLAHFSKYVRPGAVRIGTREAKLPETVSAVAFDAPRNSVEEDAKAAATPIVQLVNRGPQEETVALCSGGRVAHVTLPGVSITTASWDEDAQAP